MDTNGSTTKDLVINAGIGLPTSMIARLNAHAVRLGVSKGALTRGALAALLDRLDAAEQVQEAVRRDHE